MNWLAAAALGCALGSIPFGLLLTRAAGLGDLRRIGSGNIGATNVLRTGRHGLAAATLLLDAGKGAAAVLIAIAVWGREPGLVAGLGALLGHAYTPWLGFRGGKGVATGAGALLAAAPLVGLSAAAAWLAVAWITRTSSAGALAACTIAGVLPWTLADRPLALCSTVLSTIVVLRHRANIGRLLAGTEPRIGGQT